MNNIFQNTNLTEDTVNEIFQKYLNESTNSFFGNATFECKFPKDIQFWGPKQSYFLR